ncbi:hypothetical protein [Streptomyces sp. NPDC059076]|uniref:hypothetical protein n=1 Tax=unclassified Streptomyces TaxID=2593676 RepID=UPI00369A7F36
MDASIQAWLTAQLGTATDLADLEQRYTRLHTARAVALEVIRERLAALRSQPGSVTVSGVVGVNFGENIRAYERQITALEAGEPPAPDDPDEDGDGIPDGTGLATIQLIPRPRR